MAAHQDASTGAISAESVAAKPADARHPVMHVKVYSPFKTYFDESADSISAVNATGPFDILPRHHNFMTLLSAGELIIRQGTVQHKIRISRGVMHVKANQVIVFLDV
ncbi:MAG: atpC [Candidatus Saccharibacteria bacterium]|nr:atpC [Candidatus Saccharibacteria bacterium]